MYQLALLSCRGRFVLKPVDEPFRAVVLDLLAQSASGIRKADVMSEAAVRCPAHCTDAAVFELCPPLVTSSTCPLHRACAYVIECCKLVHACKWYSCLVLGNSKSVHQQIMVILYVMCGSMAAGAGADSEGA